MSQGLGIRNRDIERLRAYVFESELSEAAFGEFEGCRLARRSRKPTAKFGNLFDIGPNAVHGNPVDDALISFRDLGVGCRAMATTALRARASA